MYPGLTGQTLGRGRDDHEFPAGGQLAGGGAGGAANGTSELYLPRHSPRPDGSSLCPFFLFFSSGHDQALSFAGTVGHTHAWHSFFSFLFAFCPHSAPEMDGNGHTITWQLNHNSQLDSGLLCARQRAGTEVRWKGVRDPDCVLAGGIVASGECAGMDAERRKDPDCVLCRSAGCGKGICCKQ